jgi:hypothetical protein
MVPVWHIWHQTRQTFRIPRILSGAIMTCTGAECQKLKWGQYAIASSSFAPHVQTAAEGKDKNE